MQFKKFYLGMLSALLLASSATVSAQVYVGGGLGTAKRSLGCWSETPCEKSDSAFKLIGGYTLDKNFAIELNYFDLGGHHFSYAGNQVVSDFEVKSRAFSIATLAHYSFTDKLSGFAKLGVARLKSNEKFALRSSNADIQNDSSRSIYDGTHINLGIGLTYKISDQFSLRAEYEQFRLSQHVSRKAFQTMTVGAQFAF